MEEKPVNGQHKLVLNNRNSGSFTGVLDVVSFDLNEILLETELGMLHIKGKDLHVNRLDLQKKEVDIDGQVEMVNYSQIPGMHKKGSMLGKWFA